MIDNEFLIVNPLYFLKYFKISIIIVWATYLKRGQKYSKKFFLNIKHHGVSGISLCKERDVEMRKTARKEAEPVSSAVTAYQSIFKYIGGFYGQKTYYRC